MQTQYLYCIFDETLFHSVHLNNVMRRKNMSQLSPDDLKDKFWDEISTHPVVMIGLSPSSHHHVPMRAQLDQSAHAKIWFFTGRDHKIAKGGRCHVSYIAKDHKLYGSIRGILSEEHDRSIIDKHWNNAVAAWYEKGREDPNMIMLRLDMDDAEFWTADLSIKGMFKMLTGMHVSADDIGSHAEIAM